MRRVIQNSNLGGTRIFTCGIWESGINEFDRWYIVVLRIFYAISVLYCWMIVLGTYAVIFRKIPKWFLYIYRGKNLGSRCSWLFNLEVVLSHALLWLSDVLKVRMQLRSRRVKAATLRNGNWNSANFRTLFRRLWSFTCFLNYNMAHFVLIKLLTIVCVTPLPFLIAAK